MAVYEEDQYDEVRNPKGYPLKVREPNYSIKVHCSSGEENNIEFWDKK